jgi:type III secretory pathway component EscU
MGAVSVGGLVTTAAVVTEGKDRLTAVLSFAAAVCGFLIHRNLSMRDVRRVVKEEVKGAMKEHEDHCPWVIGKRRTGHEIPSSEFPEEGE